MTQADSVETATGRGPQIVTESPSRRHQFFQTAMTTKKHSIPRKRAALEKLQVRMTPPPGSIRRGGEKNTARRGEHASNTHAQTMNEGEEEIGSPPTSSSAAGGAAARALGGVVVGRVLQLILVVCRPTHLGLPC